MEQFRKDFPFLDNAIQGIRPLIYFDNAATTQKPKIVIETVNSFYKDCYANPGRGTYKREQAATQIIQKARQHALSFLNAAVDDQLVFTKSTTDSINMLAYAFEQYLLKDPSKCERPLFIVTQQEHHSNYLPWLELAKRMKGELLVVPILPSGELNYSYLTDIISEKHASIRLVAITHCSNVLGIVNDIAQISALTTLYNIPLLLDAAQSIAHLPISVKEIHVDFLVASAHKMYGPSGVGILFMKKTWADVLPPVYFGGGMVLSLENDTPSWSTPPAKFEAGTLNSEGIAGFDAALSYIETLGWTNLQTAEQELTAYFLEKAATTKELRLLGPVISTHKLPIFSFTLPIHPHDAADFFDTAGIALRAGHHCTIPLHKALDITASLRVSFGLYNTREEIDYFFSKLTELLATFHAPVHQEAHS